MYAVIKTGGKQYRVSPGDKLRVESLKADEGQTVDFDQVLMVSDGADVTIGDPLVSQAVVTGKVLSHGRGKKIEIIKFRRRKHHRKKTGHRQNYTELEIVSVNGVSASSSTSSSQQKSSTKSESSKGSDAAAAAAATAAAATAAAAAASKAKAAEAKAAEAAEAKAAEAKAADAASAEPAAPTGPAPKFLDAPNGEPDDLKKILGIGSVLEEKLNDMGIYHFSQIAAFSDTDVENINTHLSFPGRIERDEWIPQAKELAEGREGRKLKYLDGPEGEPDDLKLIHGVGPVLENKLNELGIYHFWQIGKFVQKDIDLVNDAMAFPGRIERDEWIDQAQNLAKGGEPK